MVALEDIDIEKFNENIKAVLGLRSFNTVGVLHDAAWRRRRRVEEEKGEVGPAVRSGHCTGDAQLAERYETNEGWRSRRNHRTCREKKGEDTSTKMDRIHQRI